MDRFKYNRKPKVLFCTGAGASKESGINTFRDPQTGYWRNYDPKKIASSTALEEDPENLNMFYNSRRNLLKEVIPNYFHEFVAIMQKKYGTDEIALMTTNVDDLHERTGLEQVYKIHGNLKEIVTFEGEVKDIGYRSLEGEELYSCRPNVVMFGESRYMKNNKTFDPYSEMEKVINSLNEKDLMFVVGCSNAIIDFSSIALLNFNQPKIYIVNPFFDEEMFRNTKENLIKKTACDAVPEMEDLIIKFLGVK